MADITMPQLGETVTEGTITRWAKQVGDQVAEDEILFEVSTDKVDSEVPSPAAGYLAEILVPEGETVDVGARLAVISAEPPSGASGDGGGAAQAPAAAPAPAPAPADPEPEPQAATEDTGEAAMAQEEAKQAGTPETELAGGEPRPATTGGGGGGGSESAPAPSREEPARSGASTRPADSRPAGRPEGGST